MPMPYGVRVRHYAQKARPALLIAALRRTELTYSELATAIDMDTPIELRNLMRHVLECLSEECDARGEPWSLAAIVMNKRTGKTGSGWKDGAAGISRDR